MKKVLALAGTISLAACLTMPASAADLEPPYTDPIAPAAFDWSGVYVGGLVGHGWGDKFAADVDEPDEFADYNLDGWGGGLEVGSNWQSGNVVFGLEADILFTGIDGGGLIEDQDPINTEVNHLATLTGRIGMAFERALLYFEAGGAYVSEKHTFFYDFDDNEDVFDTASDNRFGVVIGGGLEYAFDDVWIAKVEYNYMNFGDERISFEDDPLDIEQKMHAVKFGVKYKF